MYAQGNKDESIAFVFLCKQVWKEYAPGLLSLINKLEDTITVSFSNNVIITNKTT